MAGIWYRAGTASVTNGSKKVTGFGSQWKTTTYKPDKGHTFWGPDGKAYEIDYVESDTVLYLVTVYAGVTAASQAYGIDITRTSTIPAFSRELSAQLAYAQAQYDSWQQVLTGSGMVTLTAPDGQQVQVPSLSAFQPTSASLKALQALTPSAGKLPYFDGDNSAKLASFTDWARMLVACADAAAARTGLGLGSAALRIALGTKELYSRDSILGAVSQADGVPTGAIIEVGSNANGSYIKWAGGAMLCAATFTETINTAINNRWGTTSGLGYRIEDSPWAFPAIFVSAPRTWASVSGALDHGGFHAAASNPWDTGAHKRVWASGPCTVPVEYFAFGRWF